MLEVHTLLDELREDIQQNRLPLPPMPEVAVKVGRCLNDENYQANQLAKLLSADQMLAGRLVQIANSAFFRGLTPVDTVQAAITRLGGVCVRNLVNSLVVGQMFSRLALAVIRQPMQQTWRHATRVAAHSYAIARRFTDLPADEALLAGLLHNIGAMPILARIAKEPEFAPDPATLMTVIDQLQTQVGRILLEHWEFQEIFIKVVAEHEDLLRDPPEGADLVDVVLVANLHCRLGTPHHLGRVPWNGVPAFSRLGLTPEGSLEAMKEAKAEVDALQRLLQG